MAFLEFLNGALVTVQITADSYRGAVEDIAGRYGRGRFIVFARGRWESTQQKPSFGPNTSYNWHLQGGRIRVGRLNGAPFVTFVRTERDQAIQNSY